MNKTFANGGKPRRGGIALALLATTAALAGGVQVLSPATAAAAIDQGEECADPTVNSFDCETTGGGGGAESGGGTVGGGDGDVGDIVGPVEVIEVESDAPSPCATHPAGCLPSQVGGGQRPGRDGGRNPHEPRHGGKSTRAAQAPSGKLQPTWDQCKKAMAGQVVHPLDQKLARYSGLIKTLDSRIHGLYVQMEYLQSERTRLERLHAPIPAAEGFTEAIRLIEDQQFALGTRRFELSRTYSSLKRTRDGEMASLRRNCDLTFGDALDD
jgi:hypothetical protein